MSGLRSSWGKIVEDAREAIAEAVRGRQVVDLGAGGYRQAIELLALGARHVCVVDRVAPSEREPPPGVSSYVMTFSELLAQIENDVFAASSSVAFLSWPTTDIYAHSLESVLTQFPAVVLLSKNTDGTSCGWPSLYATLLRRPVRAYVPHPHNTTIVYGPPGRRLRAPFPEELAAMIHAFILSYEDAEQLLPAIPSRDCTTERMCATNGVER